MDAEKIIELEKKTAWLEDFVRELNSAVVELQNTVRKLNAEVQILNEKITAERENFPKFEKPPHY